MERDARRAARKAEKEQRSLEKEARKAEKEAKRLERVQKGEEEEQKGETPENNEETPAATEDQSPETPAENGGEVTADGKKGGKYREKREPKEEKERKPKERLVFKRKDVQSGTAPAEGETQAQVTPSNEVFHHPTPAQVEDEKEKEETEELLRKAVNAATEETPSPKKVVEAPPAKKVHQPPQPVA